MAGREGTDTDVLVMGAGLAGIMAAVWASRAGARVCIAANGAIGSGSSFYPGTWGLGLIGPESKEDEADLLDVILEIGEGMAQEELASCLVSGGGEGISELKRLGAEIKDAVNKGEREFIPCFVHSLQGRSDCQRRFGRAVFPSAEYAGRNRAWAVSGVKGRSFTD